MYHKLTAIAQTHQFNQTKFLDFAEKHLAKYGIIRQYSPSSGIDIALPREEWTISTWWVNDLVNDYKGIQK